MFLLEKHKHVSHRHSHNHEITCGNQSINQSIKYCWRFQSKESESDPLNISFRGLFVGSQHLISHSCCTMVNPDEGASDFLHRAPGSDHSEKENQSLVKVIGTQTAGVSGSFTVTSEIIIKQECVVRDGKCSAVTSEAESCSLGTSKVTVVTWIHIKQYNLE